MITFFWQKVSPNNKENVGEEKVIATACLPACILFFYNKRRKGKIVYIEINNHQTLCLVHFTIIYDVIHHFYRGKNKREEEEKKKTFSCLSLMSLAKDFHCRSSSCCFVVFRVSSRYIESPHPFILQSHPPTYIHLFESFFFENDFVSHGKIQRKKFNLFFSLFGKKKFRAWF